MPSVLCLCPFAGPQPEIVTETPTPIPLPWSLEDNIAEDGMRGGPDAHNCHLMLAFLIVSILCVAVAGYEFERNGYWMCEPRYGVLYPQFACNRITLKRVVRSMAGVGTMCVWGV